MLERLNLTDAQREQVKSIRESHKNEITAAADKAFAAHQALQGAISSEQFDESAIRARSTDVAAADADFAVLQGRIYSEVWQILTPEQQKEAKAAQAQRQARAANMRGRHNGGGKAPQ
jgi:protein CpxP